jgi:hypothetical protein
MAQVITDSAGALDLYFRIGRASVPKTFSFFDESEVAYSIAGITFQMNFKAYPGAADNIFQLTSGAGLTVGESTIAFSVTEVQSAIPEKIYFWELYDATNKRTWICRRAYFIYGDPVELEDTTSVTVKLQSDTITCTITGGSGGGITTVDGGTI